MIEDNTVSAETALVDALRSYARRLGIAEDVAIAIYRRELEVLKNGSHVQSFIEIIAEKRTKEKLRSRTR